MKAVILVGGEAIRLRPLTCNIPKAMVPVLNTPFLEYVISYLSKHRVKDVALTLGRFTKTIESYFGDGSQFGVKLSYIVEDTPLGTAGAVKNAEKYLQGSFLVLNGDIFTDLNIRAMIDFHLERKAKATIALTPVDDPTSYGLIETNTQGRVTRFLEKPSWSQVTTNMINAGTYVLEPEVLSHIPPRTSFSFERELFPLLLERGEPIYAYPSSAYWIDIGTPEKYLQLHRDLLSGKSNRFTPDPSREVIIGKQSHIHPTAQIKGPVLIGDNCTIEREVKLTGPVVLGSGCIVQSEAIIEESVIWHNVQIEQGASVKGAVIANNSHLHSNCHITDGSIIGDNVTIVSGCKLNPGSKILPETIVKRDT